MKNLLLILVSFTLITFTACEKENCRDNIVGTYSGTFAEVGGTTPLEVTLQVNIGDEDEDLLISIQSLGITIYTLTAVLNADCAVVTVPSQVVSGTTISGSLTSDGTTLKGTLFADSSGAVVDCSK